MSFLSRRLAGSKRRYVKMLTYSMPDLQRHILLVEDEAALRQAIAEQLTDHGFQVAQADSGEAALSRLADFAFDIIITDLRLPGINGSEVLESAVARYPDIVAIVVTGFGTVKDAVEAIKRGAWDFVSKPFQIDELLHALDSALEQRRLKSENAYLRAQLDERYRFEGLIGKSAVMKRLFQLLETVAPTNSTILIAGETGTGKEVVARAIHHNSARRSQRFVALNCSAIPETLLEAELFGHVRGAFTGAIGNRQGRFEQAHKGTLFLDEVGTMSTALQTKLLRALQEREPFRRADDHRLAGRDAPADGVPLARQRASARKRDRARGGVQRRAAANRCRRSAERDSAGAGSGHPVSGYAAGGRDGSRFVHRQHRTRADRTITRADRREQRAGGEAARLEADNARRETETHLEIARHQDFEISDSIRLCSSNRTSSSAIASKSRGRPATPPT